MIRVVGQYMAVEYIVLYIIASMCFISYIWMKKSIDKLTKGHMKELFSYMLWIVKWGFLCAIWLFTLQVEFIELDRSSVISSIAVFISVLFLIISYISVKMKEVSEIFGFK